MKLSLVTKFLIGFILALIGTEILKSSIYIAPIFIILGCWIMIYTTFKKLEDELN